MSMPLEAKGVNLAAANSKNDQIFKAAEAIWGIKADKLPQAKFDELKAVLAGQLTKEYGPYEVKGIGPTFFISADPKVLKTYKKNPCSLDTCMVTDAAFRCARCQKAMYCSKEHQKQDWARHKRVECISQT